MNKEHEIVICLGSSCFSRGNKQTMEIIKAYVKKKNLSAKIGFKGQLCSSLCSNGPIVIIDGQTYEGITKENILNLLEKTIST